MLVAIFLSTGCDFVANEPERGTFENEKPAVSGSLSFDPIQIEEGPRVVDLSALFSDRNGDNLAFDATADDESDEDDLPDTTVVAVSIDSQDRLVITPRGIGQSADGIGRAKISVVATELVGGAGVVGDTARYQEVILVIDGIGVDPDVKNAFEAGSFTTCDTDIEVSLHDLFVYYDEELLSYNVEGKSADLEHRITARDEDLVFIVTSASAGENFVELIARDNSTDREKRDTLRFNVGPGIIESAATRAGLEDDIYIEGREYELDLVGLDFFQLARPGNLTFELNSAGDQNNVVNASIGDDNRLNFFTSNSGDEVITVEVIALSDGVPQCEGAGTLNIVVQENKAPSVNPAAEGEEGRIQQALNAVTEEGAKACVLLTDDPPLFIDADNDSLTFDAESLAQGAAGRISVSIDKAELCVTGLNKNEGNKDSMPVVRVTATDPSMAEASADFVIPYSGN